VRLALAPKVVEVEVEVEEDEGAVVGAVSIKGRSKITIDSSNLPIEFLSSQRMFE
jgi:hypothetical protein